MNAPQEAARRLSASAIRDGYKPEALHIYTHPDGAVWYWRIRLKHPKTGQKWLRQMRKNGVGYELGEPDFPDGKPLYRLHDLAARPDDPVILVEGEWCTDRLADRGLLVTTSGAADTAAKADWRSLAGRDVTVWPDNDEVGQRYATEAAESLLAIGCTVRMIDVATLGLPKKGDVVDWLAANPAATEAEIAALPCGEALRGEEGTETEETRLLAVQTVIKSDDPTKEPRPRPQADILIDIGLNVSKALFCSDDDRPYAVIRDRSEVWGVASKRFREWLRGCYFKRVGKGANSNSVRDAVETIGARAQFSEDKRKVFLRTAEAHGNLYVDLTDDGWRVVEIDADDWRVLDRSPVMFARRGAPAPLPVPQRHGSLSELWPFLNVSEKYRPLVAGWLLAALHPLGPYPVLLLQGEEGTAKSTAARMLRSLCDPSLVPLRAPTRDEKDFLVGAVGNWCVCIDNLSGMQPWMSDALCRLSTGGGFNARTLYTDCDETSIQIERPVILNGIDVGAVRGDLLGRTMTLTLDTIPEDERKDIDDLKAAFEEARPRILGALFTGLAQAIRERPNVKLTHRPRMLGFARLVVAAETALGFEAGAFLEVYTENLTEGAITVLDNPIAQALITFVTAQKEWTGTATELLDAIAPPVDSRSASSWPKTGRGMIEPLKRFAPALRRVGIYIEHLKRSDAKGTRQLRLVCKVPAQSSEPSDPPEPRRGAGSGSDGSKPSDGSTVRESGNRQGPSEKNHNKNNTTDGSDGSDGSAGASHGEGGDRVEVEV